MSSQEQFLTCTFNALINDLKAEITKEIKSEISTQHEKLVPQNKMLQQQMFELHQLNFNKQANNEESESYGRHLCLRIEGIPLKKPDEDVLYSVKNYFELGKVNIPVLFVDHAHIFVRVYKDCALNINCKGIIVRLTTFRHKTMLYRASSEYKGIKVRWLNLV